jgi:hypothetical protein
MSHVSVRTAIVRIALAGLILVLATAASGCDTDTTANSTGASAPDPAAERPATAEPEEPRYTSWRVYINDDDSYEKGGIAYEIALNLEATNPSSEIAGTYKGTAVAKTSTTGEIGGQQLNASAIANSSNLEFSLEDVTEGTDLAPLTENAVYGGSGSITMKAAGSGTVGQASGPFSNTSSQPLKVSVSGTAATLEISIDGHKYEFNGTISGQ